MIEICQQGPQGIKGPPALSKKINSLEKYSQIHLFADAHLQSQHEHATEKLGHSVLCSFYTVLTISSVLSAKDNAT